MKNSTYHSAIPFVVFEIPTMQLPSRLKKIPYEIMLSIPSKMGLSSSIMPQSVLLLITTDEDLEN